MCQALYEELDSDPHPLRLQGALKGGFLRLSRKLLPESRMGKNLSSRVTSGKAQLQADPADRGVRACAHGNPGTWASTHLPRSVIG